MKSLVGLLVGILIALSIAAFAGENPFHILMILLKSGLGSGYDLGWTLFYSTAFIFTGLSVFLIFQVGLFNVGAEGQLYLASLGLTIFALLFPQLPAPWSWLGAILMGSVLAASSGAFVAWMKVRRNAHEVISTIMMNFISMAFVSYFVLGIFRNPDSQNPESAAIADSYRWTTTSLTSFFADTPLNLSFLLAVAVALVLHLVLRKTRWGFQMRVIGKNEKAAHSYGYKVDRVRIFTFAVGAALTVGVAINEVLGTSGKLKLGYSADYGFIGIAVAMLAGESILAVIPAAVLFGLLHKGSLDLDMESNIITKDFAKIIQALIIFSVIIFSKIPDSKFQKAKTYFLNLANLGFRRRKAE